MSLIVYYYKESRVKCYGEKEVDGRKVIKRVESVDLMGLIEYRYNMFSIMCFLVFVCFFFIFCNYMRYVLLKFVYMYFIILYGICSREVVNIWF